MSQSVTPLFRASLCVVGLGIALLSGCKDLLTTPPSTDYVDPEAIASGAGADGVRAFALQSFNEGYGGALAGPPLVIYSGVLADEFVSRDYSNANGRDLDGPTPINDPGLQRLQTARLMALLAQASYRMRPTSAARVRIGEMFSLMGYTLVLMAENYCSGIPLSTIVPDGDIRVSPGIATDSVLRLAVANFDSAIVYAADSVRILNWARVGRGRALLNLGQFADAGTATALVDKTYAYNATYTNAFGSRDVHNNVYQVQVNFLRFWWIADRKGGNGLPYVSSNDPRVATRSINAPPGRTAFLPLAYPNGNTPIQVASGIEARLIEAEAALQRADFTAWLAILNDLRATAITPAMSALADPGTQVDREDLLFRERAFWLYGTAHRLGDLRRLLRQYGRTQNAVFPVGTYQVRNTIRIPVVLDTLTFGNSVNIPVWDANNPIYAGCGDRTK